MKDKLLYLFLGFFMALSLFLLIASGNDGEVGRYQIACQSANAYIIDTQTGAVIQVDLDRSVTNRGKEFIPYKIIQEALSQ